MVMTFFRVVVLLSVYTVCAFAQNQTHNQTTNSVPGQDQNHSSQSQESVTHVHTALGHVSLLEFKEPVTAAAAGSKIFHIERLENKVLITPLKAGIATNLFVWTASQRFSYELDPPGEVANLAFAIDPPSPDPKPAPDVKEQQMRTLSGLLLTDAILGADPIDSSAIKRGKDRVTLRVEQVFRTNDELYIYYTLDNQSKLTYRATSPSVYQLVPGHSSISIPSLRNRQLNQDLLAHLGATQSVAIPLAHAEFESRDVPAGVQKPGVVVIRLNVSSSMSMPMVFQLVVGDLKATVVLVRSHAASAPN